MISGFQRSVASNLLRFESLGRRILPLYGLESVTLQPLQALENVTFRVSEIYRGHPRHRQFLLRFHGNQNADFVESECCWLTHLNSSTDILVPKPLHTQEGKFSSCVEEPDSARNYICSVLQWLPGKQLEHPPLRGYMLRLGRLVGQLHMAATRWTPPNKFLRPRWDWNGLFYGIGGFANVAKAGWQHIPAEYHHSFRRATDLLACLMKQIGDGQESFGLIHADIHLGNIIFQKSSLGVIDFDDCGFGYWVYDIATALRPHRLGSEWTDVRSSFLQGYADFLPRCDLDHLDAFIVARHLATTLWAASRSQDTPQLASTLINRCELVRTVLGVIAQ